MTTNLGQEIEQEPNQWREMVVVSLVREGVNKHRARELADHFAAQPEQQDSCFCHDGVSLQIVSGGAAPEGYLGKVTLLIDGKYVDYVKAQPEQEPVTCRFCHSKKGSWAWQCYNCGEIDDVQKPTPPAAQRPWQGLTEDEKFEIAAAQYGWEDLLIAAEAKLKERNK